MSPYVYQFVVLLWILFLPGYGGTGNWWDDFSGYGNAEGVDIASVSFCSLI